jgi:hypothetical protein
MELLLALAKQDVVPAYVEARHVGVAQPAATFQTEQVAVEALALFQIVDGMDQCVTPSILSMF